MLEVLEGVRAQRYRGDGSFRGYVWRITSSNCLDYLRLRRRWVEVEIDESVLPHQEASALVALLSSESRSRLLALAARLPRQCRELWRDLLAGHSYREMSRSWGVSEGALRVRVLRCRRQALRLGLEALEAPASELGNETGEPTPNSPMGREP